MIAPRLSVAVACLLLGLPAARAQEVRLSDVAKQAAKPDSAQQVVGQQELSDTKTKADADQPTPAIPVRQDSSPPPTPPSEGLGWSGGGFVVPPPGPGPSYLPAPEPGGAPPEALLRLGTFGGYGGLDGGPIEGVGSAGILVGFAGGPWSVDLRGRYQRAGLEAALDRAFDGFDGLAADLVLRRRLTPEGARWPTHLLVTGRLGRYGWDYRNPVEVTQGGGTRIVSDDRVGFRALLGGLGIDLARSQALTVGLAVEGGVQGFDDRTREGFVNDLFERHAVFEVLAELVYTPPW